MMSLVIPERVAIPQDGTAVFDGNVGSRQNKEILQNLLWLCHGNKQEISN